LIPVKQREKMTDSQEKLSLTRQCKVLALNRNFLYYSPKGECEQNLKIMKLLDEQYFLTPFYGYRKMDVWLQTKGFKVNPKRLRRLMELVCWQTIYRQPRTSICNQEHKKYPYLLRDLEITHKNQVWATDITYVPINKGFMYLTAIIDLHTRYVLNWDVSNTMSADWCASVLQETIEKHGKPEIFNTDQGSQYTSEVHINVLLSNEIEISMDGKGRAIDNIFVERLWRSVKYENVYLQSYPDGLSLRKGMKSYFEFYNNERFHQSLDYQTPAQKYRSEEVA
jgi:putative transposase